MRDFLSRRKKFDIIERRDVRYIHFFFYESQKFTKAEIEEKAVMGIIW